MHAGQEPSDAELVDAANRGDRAAFGRLYERHVSFVHAVAWRMTRDHDVAAEITQETFLWWLRRFPGFTLRAKVTTFLYPVVRNLARDRARRAGRTLPLDAEPPDPAAGEAECAGPISGEALRGAIARLTPVQQEILILRAVQGLELAEIAEALEIPVGTVKSRLHAAVTALRRG